MSAFKQRFNKNAKKDMWMTKDSIEKKTMTEWAGQQTEKYAVLQKSLHNIHTKDDTTANELKMSLQQFITA